MIKEKDKKERKTKPKQKSSTSRNYKKVLKNRLLKGISREFIKPSLNKENENNTSQQSISNTI
jgi:hypothetical protein